jgi:hypothetical protein
MEPKAVIKMASVYIKDREKLLRFLKSEGEFLMQIPDGYLQEGTLIEAFHAYPYATTGASVDSWRDAWVQKKAEIEQEKQAKLPFNPALRHSKFHEEEVARRKLAKKAGFYLVHTENRPSCLNCGCSGEKIPYLYACDQWEREVECPWCGYKYAIVITTSTRREICNDDGMMNR